VEKILCAYELSTENHREVLFEVESEKKHRCQSSLSSKLLLKFSTLYVILI